MATRLQILKSGLGPKDFVDQNEVNRLIVAALPHWNEYINEHGPTVYSHIRNALDDRLLEEINKMLAGVEADRASIDQAAEIVRRANAALTADKARDSENGQTTSMAMLREANIVRDAPESPKGQSTG